MQFDDNEIQELADFFSRRFPEADQRQRMASAAGLSDGFDDWKKLLHQAQTSNRLSRLADVTAAAAPEDDNLRDVCTILTAPRRRRRATMAASAVVVGLLAAVVGLGLSATEPAPVEAPAAVLASAAVNPPPAPLKEATRPVPSAPPVASAAPAAPSLPAPEAAHADAAEGDSAPEATSGSLEAAAATGSDAEEAAAVPSPFAATAPLTGRCRAKGGALVGYWYAGATAPGTVGADVEIPVTVNVRADFPDVHNNFNARAPVRCVLHKGERLVLSGEPIQVPGDRYWVPLYGGDFP